MGPQSFLPVSSGASSSTHSVTSSTVPLRTTAATTAGTQRSTSAPRAASHNRTTSNASRVARELQNNLLPALFAPPTDPYLPCHSRHFASRWPQQQQPQQQQQSQQPQQQRQPDTQATPIVSVEETLTGLVTNLISSLNPNRGSHASTATAATILNSTQGQQEREQLESQDSSRASSQQQEQQQIAHSRLTSLLQGTLDSSFNHNDESIADFFRSLGQDFNIEEEAGLFSDLFAILTRQLTISDFIVIFLGNHQPIRKLYSPLKSFVRDKILEGKEGSEENIRAAVEGILNNFHDDITEMAGIVVARDDIDFAASTRIAAADEDSIDDDSNGSYTSASANVLESMDVEEGEPSSPGVHDLPNSHLVDVHNPGISQDSGDSYWKNGEAAENVDWHSIVPQEWVSVITGDGARQRRQAAENTMQLFSEAYLSGVPKKRRKLMKERSGESSFPPGSELGMDLSESIRIAADELDIQPITSFQELNADLASNNNLLGAYKEEIKDTISKKLSEDPNFSPNKYPNAEKYFGSGKK
ncbi:hypothetical protein HELRODRAFT_187806 [Helobdella robusta]|uniref:Large proline-rich protein BAG6 domain-containing protein n=1 Tax=Helobdella robusta TaxID=6412 RepID=T1FPE1_HELRO|nr:hypothetical protein HELRODRAFT_187806 [Helobdella robusta]ESO12243.1 hypothetical protein HELRODRAFT_187806 [Helobdella robusta]